MPIAAVALEFDPVLRLGDIAVRLQLVVLALVLLGAVLVAAAIARRHGLRLDDLLFIVVGVVPGAVVGGRVGYVLAHVDHYGAAPSTVLDPGQGSLALGLAVVGGAMTGAIVARILGAPLGSWLRVAAVPLLVAIAAGKLSMLLGGSGQGQPSDAPWALAFVGPGSWGSLAPDIPSHPAQAYEAIGTGLVLVLVALLARSSLARDGRLFAIAVGGWAAARAVTGAFWRDPPAIGPMGAEQAMAVLIALGAGAVVVLYLLGRGIAPGVAATAETGEDLAGPEWPDPAARPPF